MAQLLSDVLLIIVLIGANGFFALTELAIVSARKQRLKELADTGSRGALLALELKESPELLLSTVQIGITLVSIIIGAVASSMLSDSLEPMISRLTGAGPHVAPLAIVVVVVAITLCSILFGEFIPKFLALQDPERCAVMLSRPMNGVVRLFSWPMSIFSSCTAFFFRALGVAPRETPTVTEEEITSMIEQGAEEGVLKEVEEEMVKRVLRLDKWTVNALMTPRKDVEAIDITAPFGENLALMLKTGHSFFPVYEGDLDHLLGVISLKDVLEARLEGLHVELKELVRRPLLIPTGTVALKLIEQLKVSGGRIAIVVDQHGTLDGVITLHDILEALVGIVSSEEEERHEPQVIERADGSFLLDGSLHIDTVKDLMGSSTLPGEEMGGFHTLAGFIMSELGSIPREGQSVECGGWKLEVVDMDGHRVDKVLVTAPQAAELRTAAER